MTFYIGYSVTLEEACRLTGVTYDLTDFTYKGGVGVNYYERKERLEDTVNKKLDVLTLSHTDKGQYIIGLTAVGPEVAPAYDTLISVTESCSKLMSLAAKVKRLISMLKLDLSDIEISGMESEPYRASYPEPFLIYWN